MTAKIKTELAELWAQVKANLARLRTCEGHRFPPLTAEFRRKYRCEVCGGEAEVDYVLAYCDGYRAAGKNPSEVCSNIETR